MTEAVTLTLFLMQIAERKPPSLAAVIGIAISWIVAAITILRFKMDIAKARRELEADTRRKIAERDDELMGMVKRACDSYLMSSEFNERRDARIRDLIAIATRDALDKYGPSFASAESKLAVDQRFDAIEKDVRAIQTFLASRVQFTMPER